MAPATHPYPAYTYLLGLALLGIGLVSGPAPQSIGMGLMAAGCLWHAVLHRQWPALRRHPATWGLLTFFALTLLGGLYTGLPGAPVGEGVANPVRNGQVDHMAGWLDEMRIKAPLLLAVLCLLAAPPLPPRLRPWAELSILLPLAVVGVANMVRYTLHYHEINEMMARSKPFPIVAKDLMYIYYGAAATLGTLWAGYRVVRPLLPRWVYISIALILVVNVHVAGSRTGLLALYAALALLLAATLVRRPRLGLAALGLAILLPLAAFSLSSSVRQRVYLSLGDLTNYQKGGDLSDWSLGRRLAAWHCAGSLIAEHPLAGTGPTNIELAMDARYRQMQLPLRPERQVYVHNQYIESTLAYGVGGLVALLALLALPLWYYRRQPMVPALLVAFALALFFESMLERQAGISILVLLLALVQLQQQPDNA